MLTKILRPVFEARYIQLEKHSKNTEDSQRRVLQRLVRGANGTLWGREHDFGKIKCYEDFVRAVPVTDYASIGPYVQRMMNGEKNILWGGNVNKFVITSGTSGEFSKYLPLSDAAMRDTHIKGGFDSVSLYLHSNPASRILDGKSLILGANFYDEPKFKGVEIGTISAQMIKNGGRFLERIRVPSMETALMADFQKKIEMMAKLVVKENITNISGIPPWILQLLKLIIAQNDRQTLLDIWPNMEVFFHGGVSMEPYRSVYKEIFPCESMQYRDVYNASEGFFAIQDDPFDTSMRLMIDYGVFYEFKSLEGSAASEKLIPLWEIELGHRYALHVSTSSGLWRYPVGDVVHFTGRDPYKLQIDGRVTGIINISAEKLTEETIQKALSSVCEQTGVRVLEYTVAPNYPTLSRMSGLLWLIEFENEPQDMALFESLLDQTLGRWSCDYKAVRNGRLGPLSIVNVRRGLFNDWLKANGRLGGQHKVPRVLDNRKTADELLAI